MTEDIIDLVQQPDGSWGLPSSTPDSTTRRTEPNSFKENPRDYGQYLAELQYSPDREPEINALQTDIRSAVSRRYGDVPQHIDEAMTTIMEKGEIEDQRVMMEFIGEWTRRFQAQNPTAYLNPSDPNYETHTKTIAAQVQGRLQLLGSLAAARRYEQDKVIPNGKGSAKPSGFDRQALKADKQFTDGWQTIRQKYLGREAVE